MVSLIIMISQGAQKGFDIRYLNLEKYAFLTHDFYFPIPNKYVVLNRSVEWIFGKILINM